MNRFCKFTVMAFALLYLAALGLLLIGTFGLFGNERDPLSGIFLIPLGLPWIWLVDWAPGKLWPWLAAATPASNLLILVGVCKLLAARKNHSHVNSLPAAVIAIRLRLGGHFGSRMDSWL